MHNHDTKRSVRRLKTNQIQMRRLYLILLIYPNALLDDVRKGRVKDFPSQAIEEGLP